MREIVFRGKRLDNGEWVFGCLISHTRNEQCKIGRGYYKDINLGEQLDADEVVPATVGQYIGRKDKKWIDVYEGDVVNGLTWLNGKRTEYSGIIEYIYSGFHVRGINEWAHMVFDIDGNLEIIGSIHDNPELLEGE